MTVIYVELLHVYIAFYIIDWWPVMRRNILYVFILLIILSLFYLLSGIHTPENNNTLLNGKLAVSIIDVGQGDCSLIQTPDKRNILIDAGTHESSENIIRYLTNRGVNRIDLLVITHPHNDHIGGMLDVLDHFGVSEVLDSGYSHGSQTYKNLLTAILKRRIKYITPENWVDGHIGKNVMVHLLWPTDDAQGNDDSDLNDRSLVLRISYGNVSFLFTGDIGSGPESRILADEDNIASTVLKVAHHGSSHGTTNEFIQAVRPDYAVISVGADNSYGHPSKKILKRLKASGARVFRTDQDGSVMFITDGNNLEVKTNQ